MDNRDNPTRPEKEYHLSPSLLSADTTELGRAVKQVERAGANSLHIDVMDGHYVRNFAFSPKNIADLARITDLPLHVHLETDNPEDCIPLFPTARMIIVQEDTSTNLEHTLSMIRAAGFEAGVGINPSRPVEQLYSFLHLVRLALVMAVEPGFGGQSFDRGALGKVEMLRRERKKIGRSFWIGIDGGLNPSTVPLALEAGCDYFIIGSGIFGPGKDQEMVIDPAERVNLLSRMIREVDRS